jgi:predicted ATP-dependent protease
MAEESSPPDSDASEPSSEADPAFELPGLPGDGADAGLNGGSHPGSNGNIPPPAWSDAKLPISEGARDAHRVDPSRVTMRTDPAVLPETPGESHGLFELVSPIARRALDLGLMAREPSFHVFVAAESEVFIEDDLVQYAEHFARSRPAPPDIVYVHDFEHPEAPRPLLLPSGVGHMLVAAMDALVDKLQHEIPNIAHSDALREAQVALARELETKNKAVLSELESTAKNLGFGIRAVQGGVQTYPILHGKPVSAEQFGVLDDSTKRALTEAEERLATEVERSAALVQSDSARYQEARDEAFSRAAEELIHGGMAAMRSAFEQLKDALGGYFDSVEQALVDDWEDLVQPDSDDEESDSGGRDHDPEHATRLNRFKVNLLVSNDPDGASPVLYDTNPTYPNLFGYLERRARFGALLTDFTRIRAGSLHKASGGILIVRAADLLADPIIWERMKRVLRERRIGAEDPLGPLGLYATSLRPVPVPIQVRVVLVGPAHLYSALLEADADFASLFRVKVEIEPTIARTQQNLHRLDSYLMNMAKEREWGEFDRSARARLLDLATRLAGEQDKLSLSLSPLEETAAFAGASAAVRGASVISEEDVEEAWRERRERAGAAERHIRELTLRGEVALETAGQRIGVVNGLSVFSAGDVEFGQPMRITAVVALGREGIVDVEREAQLGGSIHTKGVAILRGYLGRLFGQERPLSLRAQIAFEQSYGEIDGDSASSSELFTVLSALADVGIDQGLAVTGSVNQLGEIQAIGGVCAKIEGFFDLCAARGLNAAQGVLIPRSNIGHLVLRADVAKAIAEGKFHLYAVSCVEEGIEILTGLRAGERDISGRFPAASVFGRVERRLIEIAERLREAEAHSHHHDGHESPSDKSGTDLGDTADFRRP